MEIYKCNWCGKKMYHEKYDFCSAKCYEAFKKEGSTYSINDRGLSLKS